MTKFKMADASEHLILADIGKLEKVLLKLQADVRFMFYLISFHANFQGDEKVRGAFCPTVMLHAKFQGSAETRTEYFAPVGHVTYYCQSRDR